MKFISAQKIRKIIRLNSLISEIENVYKNDADVPLRQVYHVSPKKSSDQLMLMPAFSVQGFYGVKLLKVSLQEKKINKNKKRKTNKNIQNYARNKCYSRYIIKNSFVLFWNV